MCHVVWGSLDGEVGLLRRPRAAQVVLEVRALGGVELGNVTVTDGDREVRGDGPAVVTLALLARALQ
jgi:hypothetical protein